MVIDTHAHLLQQFYREEIDEVVNHSKELIVNIVGFDIESSDEAINRANLNSNFYSSVGIHPNDLKSKKDLSYIEILARNQKVIAIGEIGLDYFRDSTPRSLQIGFFEEQIEIAKRLSLPYIVHSRESFDDTFRVIKDSGYDKCVMHSFDYDTTSAMKIIENGSYISFSGMLTFNGKKELKEVASLVPLERVFFETDSPFLSPTPLRGSRNEPQYVKFVYEKFAEIRNLDISIVQKQIFENFKVLFNKFKE